MLADRGAALDAFYYCPYHPHHGDERYRRDSDDRKPGPGMLLRAQRDLNLDLARSWVVGDSERDLESGRRAGVPHLFLVRTGNGASVEASLSAELRAQCQVVDDLPQAIERVLDSR